MIQFVQSPRLAESGRACTDQDDAFVLSHAESLLRKVSNCLNARQQNVISFHRLIDTSPVCRSLCGTSKVCQFELTFFTNTARNSEGAVGRMESAD